MDFFAPPKRSHLRKRSLFPAPVTDTLQNGFPTDFVLAPNQAPKDFVASHCSPGTYQDNGRKVKFDKGTTTLAFRFQHGVIVAVDSRASQGTYISSQTVQKVIPITDKLLGTMAGGAADCLFWQRNLGSQVRLHELRNKERISVAAASKLLANNMMSYKGKVAKLMLFLVLNLLSLIYVVFTGAGLSMGTMVTGYDTTGAQLYYIDDDGTRLKATRSQPYFSVGSGSTYAYGILDTEYKWDLSIEDAVKLGRRAIYHAGHRDGASGGMNNVYVVAGEKWEKLEPIDVNDMHEDVVQERIVRLGNAMDMG